MMSFGRFWRPAITGLIAATLLAAPALAQGGLSTTFTGQTVKPAPCAAALVCGPVTMPGYGAAYLTVAPTFLGEFNGSCAPAAAEITIALTDGTGSLTLLHSGTLCLPGRSELRPSYGNPNEVTGTYEVIRGTGVFAGATGAGDAVFHAAGASWRVTLDGTLVTRR